MNKEIIMELKFKDKIVLQSASTEYIKFDTNQAKRHDELYSGLSAQYICSHSIYPKYSFIKVKTINSKLESIVAIHDSLIKPI